MLRSAEIVVWTYFRNHSYVVCSCVSISSLPYRVWPCPFLAIVILRVSSKRVRLFDFVSAFLLICKIVEAPGEGGGQRLPFLPQTSALLTTKQTTTTECLPSVLILIGQSCHLLRNIPKKTPDLFRHVLKKLRIVFDMLRNADNAVNLSQLALL